jgi:fructose-specific phosphotransferase system IIC component
MSESGYGLKISWLFTILWVALGYFVYGGLSGALAILVLSLLFDVVILVSLIPFVGVVIQGLIMNYLIAPWVFGVTSITATWLTTSMFWINIIIGFVLTIIMSIATIAVLKE